MQKRKQQNSPSASVSRKKCRARLPGDKQAEIWRYIEVNPRMLHRDVAAYFGIQRSTVSKILKRKNEILDPQGYQRCM